MYKILNNEMSLTSSGNIDHFDWIVNKFGLPMGEVIWNRLATCIQSTYR